VLGWLAVRLPLCSLPCARCLHLLAGGEGIAAHLGAGAVPWLVQLGILAYVWRSWPYWSKVSSPTLPACPHRTSTPAGPRLFALRAPIASPKTPRVPNSDPVSAITPPLAYLLWVQAFSYVSPQAILNLVTGSPIPPANAASAGLYKFLEQLEST